MWQIDATLACVIIVQNEKMYHSSKLTDMTLPLFEADTAKDSASGVANAVGRGHGPQQGQRLAAKNEQT